MLFSKSDYQESNHGPTFFLFRFHKFRFLNRSCLPHRVCTIAKSRAGPQATCPADQINQLTSRQQFLDLIRYLIEIRDGGVSRSKELQPSDALLTLKLPEYEERIDPSGFINDWGPDSLARGEAIYRRVCGNCHGLWT